MLDFAKRCGYSPFWILASRDKKKTKRASRDPHEGNKFYILDETEHNPKNFGIFVFHHSKVVYILHFVFYGELNTPKI